MEAILNLTQHRPLQDQMDLGVENLPDKNWDEVKSLITFNTPLTKRIWKSGQKKYLIS